ncbi:MAG: oligosaccharide flippase family protein [Candidatus Hydrogenedentes bacterium]|nr:oligosaccharide flippase family protein [Candidatus Hydrogenedentota bacterium]
MSENPPLEPEEVPYVGRVWRSVGIVLTGRAGAAVASLATTLIIARALGPVNYGLFAVLAAILNVAAGLLSPAIDTSAVRCAAQASKEHPDAALPYFRAALRLKLWLVAATVAAGVSAAPWLTTRFLADTSVVPSGTTALAFVGAATLILWGFAQAFLQTREEFKAYAGYEFLNALVRLSIVVVLVAGTSTRLGTLFGTYALAPVLVTVFSWLRLPRPVLAQRKVAPALIWELIHFGKWVAAASIATSLAQRLDLFLLSWFQVPKDALGHYGAAASLVLMGDLVILTLFQVLLPQASRLHSNAEMRAFLHRFLVPLLAAGVAMLPLILGSSYVVEFAFGAAYSDSAGLFSILLSGATVAFVCAPAGAAVYAMGRPRLIAALEAVKLISIFLPALWVVPHYGPVGMACTVAAVKGTMGVITYAVAYRVAGSAPAFSSEGRPT